MGKLILIRHGDIKRDESRKDFDVDELTKTAMHFTSLYPKILEERNLAPDLVLYESTKNNAQVNRCRQTIQPFSDLCECKPIKVQELEVELTSNPDKTIVLCYMSEHIYLWPKIEGTHFICRYAGIARLVDIRKLHRDMLYKYMLICDFNEIGIRYLEDIQTVTIKHDYTHGY
jgi:hypothetical protein